MLHTACLLYPRPIPNVHTQRLWGMLPVSLQGLGLSIDQIVKVQDLPSGTENNVFSNQFGISGIPETWITLDELLEPF